LCKPMLWWRRRDSNLRPRAYEFLAVRFVGVRRHSLMSGFRRSQAKKRGERLPAAGCGSPRTERNGCRNGCMTRTSREFPSPFCKPGVHANALNLGILTGGSVSVTLLQFLDVDPSARFNVIVVSQTTSARSRTIIGQCHPWVGGCAPTAGFALLGCPRSAKSTPPGYQDRSSGGDPAAPRCSPRRLSHAGRVGTRRRVIFRGE